MAYLAIKYLLSAAVVVIVSEIARHSGRFGALVGALPLIALLSMIWMHVERQPLSNIGNYARYTFWYVVPTLPMFLAFPWLLQRHGFVPALVAFCVGMALIFLVFALALRGFGIDLL